MEFIPYTPPKKVKFLSEDEFNERAMHQFCDTCIEYPGPEKRCPKHTWCTNEVKGRYRALTYEEYKEFYGPSKNKKNT